MLHTLHMQTDTNTATNDTHAIDDIHTIIESQY